MDTLFSEWISTVGLPALLVGAIFEGDVIALLGGALAHRGVFGFFPAALTIALGAFIWDQSLFQIGRHASGSRRLARLTGSAVMGRVRAAVGAHPVRTALAFRFLYGLRTVCPLALGASAMPVGLFVLADGAAVLVWAHLFCALGYGMGQGIERMLGRLVLHRHLLVVLGVLVAMMVVAWALHRRGRATRR